MLMAELFAVDVATINEHLKKIYESNELGEMATIRNFLIVQNDKLEESPTIRDFLIVENKGDSHYAR